MIACGGGGIPVIDEDNAYKGIDAVIDKDSTSALLARVLDADVLMVLTAVDYVAINFNQPNMKSLERINSKELKQYVEEGHFAKGSMLPKVLAALEFLEDKEGRTAIITSLENSAKAITDHRGTIISNEF